MPFGDFVAWRRELLLTGDLAQEGDTSVSDEEAERRYDRYVELADMIDGTEGPAAVQALIASLRAEEDYGAHEAVYGALERFPSQDFVSGTVRAAAALVAIPRDNSGAVLQLLSLLADDDNLRTFTGACRHLDPQLRAKLTALIADHEADEWLADERSHGRLQLPH
ncbi:hypothetical protein [Streptomyces purpurogeneiscleroticus]|uniref:hypothetical protein n=1 Tax=Streptomyces purpurogeneiscleroticus TaxID=68259 RepID=UPI001CBB0F19|nr:hypothetical protein [Streptomyces purpurogeneiscleroticus]MBZ4020082.1 hypothetical protein [Streptomyces purpurogeneiscleroticus]